jgi:hypothetical protein
VNTQTPRRLRMRAAVHITPVDDGLYCVGWQETLKISGSAALGRLWTALFPHLHRGADPEALTEALPPPAREAARRLLDELLEKGFLRDEPADGPAADEESVHPEHRRTLAFLDSAVDDPAAAFGRLRSHPIAVHGRGPLAESAARCLLSLGAGRIEVDEPTEELLRFASERGAVLGPAGGPPVRIRIDPSGPVDEPAAATIGAAQLRDRIVISPPCRDEGDPDLATLLARMRDRGAETETGPVPQVAATLAGDLAAMQVFYELTGVSTEYDGQAYLVEASRLQTTVHPLWPVGSSAAEPLEADRPAATGPDRIGELCDPVTGVLPAAEPGGLPQMPLALAACGEGFGWGETGDVARYRAALAASRDLAAADPQVKLWPLGGGEPLEAAAAVACVGESPAAMLCDGVNRLIATWLANPAERERRFGPSERETGGPEGDLVIEVRRPRRAPGLTVAAVMAEGSLISVFAHPDGATARRVVIRHAEASLQSGDVRGPVPVLAVPPGAPQSIEADLWDAAGGLADLCEPGERPAAARRTAEPALDELGAIGWIGVHVSGGAR